MSPDNPPPPLQTWDKHMLCSRELGVLNPNNDVSYYALQCPPPVKNRDFVLQRSWLQTPQEVGSGTNYIYIKDPVNLEINLFSIFNGTSPDFLYQLVRRQLKKLVSVLHHQPQCLSQRLPSTKRVCQRPVLPDGVPRDPPGQQELHPRLRGSL